MKSCPIVLIVIAHTVVDELPFGQSSRQYGYNHCIQVLSSKQGGYAYLAKITATLQFLQTASYHPNQLYILMDAFDTYFRHGPHELVQRFRHTGKRVVISSEINFIHQPGEWKPYFDNLSTQESRYLNSGVVMGYGDMLRMLLEYSANSSLLKLASKRGTDQASISDAIVHHGFSKFNGSLDYKQRIAYTASAKRWSLKLSNEDIAKYDPVIVHFPFTAAPRVNRTFYASYDGHRGDAWPEADYNFCRDQEKACSLDHNGPYCHIGGGHRPGMNRLAC